MIEPIIRLNKLCPALYKYIPLKEALKDTRKRRTFKKKKMLTGVDAEKIFKGDDEVQKRK